MVIRGVLTFSLLFAQASSRLPSTSAPPPPVAPAETEAQAKTVADMRNVGTALFSWLTDQIEADSAAANAETDSACVSGESEGGCQIVQIDKLPLISHDELVQLLVPAYIPLIPERDGWGNPYEFRLERRYVLNRNVMSIRSAGKDGSYSGSRYELGSFPATDSAQDLVWKDGFFIRWPNRRP